MLSTICAIKFIGFSSEPSRIYEGFELIVSGGVGCGIIKILMGLFQFQ